MTTEPDNQPTDAELLGLARGQPDSPAGRKAASALFARHQGRVLQWCQRYARDREQALDLAQEVLLSAYRNLDSFGERAQFSSWLFAITRNRCISAARRPALLRDEDCEPEEVVDPGIRPDEELELLEEEETVRELMRRHLDRREQEALWLRCFERLPVDEITGLLGIDGASGARGVLQSARRKLRTALGSSWRQERAGDQQ